MCDSISWCPFCIFMIVLSNEIMTWLNVYYWEQYIGLLGWPRNIRGICWNLAWKRWSRMLTTSINVNCATWIVESNSCKNKNILLDLKGHVQLHSWPAITLQSSVCQPPSSTWAWWVCSYGLSSLVLTHEIYIFIWKWNHLFLAVWLSLVLCTGSWLKNQIG